jgi:hypothetical protein
MSNIKVVIALTCLRTAWPAQYSAATALSNFYLSVSAYCGEPKFNATFLQGWQCGPSCTDAGSVDDITQFSDSSRGVFGLVGRRDGHCLLVFRGTATSDGWKTDLDATLTDFTLQPSCTGCQVENGFYNGYMAVRPTIVSALASYGCQDVTLTGHSLGAALATLAAADLGQNYTINDVYNFGSPRVGNPAFAQAYNQKFHNHWRVTHYKDPIPHGPTLGMGFYHVANEAYYKNTTAEGYQLCTSGEDRSGGQCADQFGGNLLADIGLALCCADDHLDYMQDTVSIPTDGSSCVHVAVDTAVKHAYLATAAYCEPDNLRKWDCGAPCDHVSGGVAGVEIIDVPFKSMRSGGETISGRIRGFVGRLKDRCILSLANPFGNEYGLKVIKNATADDLEQYPIMEPDLMCSDCKVYRVVVDAWRQLEAPLGSILATAGCSRHSSTTSGRRLIVTGHGLGASLGAFAAFQLKDGTGYKKGSFGVEASFQFGAVRIGNEAFVKVWRRKIAQDMFRVTHRQDPYVHYPSKQYGFVHMDQELHFPGDATYDPSSYVRCPNNGEDPRCMQLPDGPMTDHSEYLKPLVEVEMSAASCRSPLISIV